MSLFSSITDALDIPDSDSIGDDNAGLSAEQNNSFISGAVLAMRTAYDGIHTGFRYIIKGKKSSLKQATKYIDKWIEVLDNIVKKYEELLSQLNDISADITGTLTLDFAKEAWEIIQDTPILRRYLGEANYWYLYDTLGLLATQSGSLSADALSGIKEAIKQAIIATLSATEGLIGLQSYCGYLQSTWGFLYLKSFKHVTLDSVLPQVTTAYWYKKPSPSKSSGSTHAFQLNNNPPGEGFVPLPLPVPEPEMLIRQASYIGKFDYQNPDTWYLGNQPYYMPNSMALLHQALQYWGSSYTNAVNIPNAVYSRRSYSPNGKDESKPLNVGSTFSQLDTGRMSVSGTNIPPSTSSKASNDYESLLDDVFTPSMLGTDGNPGPMVKWRDSYRKAYTLLLEHIHSYYGEGKSIPSTVAEFSAAHGDDYKKWISGTNAEAINLKKYIGEMLGAVQQMKVVFASDHGLVTSQVTVSAIFDSVMKALIAVGRLATDNTYRIGDDDTYMVGLSYDLQSWTGVTTEQQLNMGIPHVVYKVDTSKNTLATISSGKTTTEVMDTVYANYDVSDMSFVMFPSSDTVQTVAESRWLQFSYVAQTLQVTLTDVPAGIMVGNPVNTGVINEYKIPFDKSALSISKLGSIPESLYKHRSCGIVGYKPIVGDTGNTAGTCLGNIFFPTGEIPDSLETAVAPPTFLDAYESFIGKAQDSTDELADVVGYSINRGRESKFPCFGVYGNLICMSSWCYKEMPYNTFIKQYAPIKSGSKLYYLMADPSKVVLYYSSYTSQSRQMQMAVYHDSVASETKSYGLNDTYTYYVFPGESVSITKLPSEGILGYNLGMLLSTDATSPSGDRYHYSIIKNPIPYSPKYVDPQDWSFMDIVYEMLLLAQSLSGLCGDNGKRLLQLEEDIKDFGFTVPTFLGELPKNNGQYVDFRCDILQQYSKKIEDALNSVYAFRDKLIAATNAW